MPTTTGAAVVVVEDHIERAEAITAALDAGVPLRDVQEAASHADPRTTTFLAGASRCGPIDSGDTGWGYRPSPPGTVSAGGGGRGQVVGT